MSQFCFICSKLLTKNESVTVDRGMKTLIDASIERADEFSEYLQNQISVTIHLECRKNYTRKSSIASAKRRHSQEEASTSKISPPRTRARVSDSAFCFKQCCLFCGDQLNEQYETKKPKHLRRKFFNVTTLSFKESVLKAARDRNDDMGRAIVARVGFEFDLVAAEAKYHNDCYNSFLKPVNGGKVGRPKDEATNLAMEEIFKYIETSDDCQFTLNELKEVCKDTSLDNRTIKIRLKVKYGNKIIISEKSGTSTFICFVDNHHEILNQGWYEKRKFNEKEERLRILEAAAAIIREDIQSAAFDNTDYPPPGRMFEDLNSVVPESLTHFLELVIEKNKRSNIDHFKLICRNISHSIMTAVRPRSFKSKLQLGLSVFFIDVLDRNVFVFRLMRIL